MKKSLVLLMLILITPIIMSCNSQTSTVTFDNPNSDLCIESSSTPGTYICEKVTSSYFDTTISFKIYFQSAIDSFDVEEVFDYFIETTETHHQYFDKYNSYEGITNIYDINQSTSEVILDDILYNAIEYGITYSNLVTDLDDNYLFNIALNPVLEIWHNTRNNGDCEELELGINYCPLPTDELDGISFNTSYDDITLNSTNKSIEFLKPGMGIDLGGFAKGYLANVLEEHLNDLNITYLLNIGNSNIITNGNNPTRDTGLYYIALEKPVTDFTLSREYYQYIKIPEGKAVVTSGVNQRFFKDIDTGDIYHHIINPNTNYPGGFVKSITIITSDSAKADILSTSLFLLDLESAKQYVNITNDLEAVWYLYDDTVEYSDGFEQYNYELN